MNVSGPTTSPAVNASKPTAMHCPSIAVSKSVLTANNQACQAQHLGDICGQQKCEAEERCRKVQKENQQTTDCPPSNQFKNSGSKKTLTKFSGETAESRVVTSEADVVVDHLSSYGFIAADWVDESFIDDDTGTDTAAKPLQSSVANKDSSRSTKPYFKIYEDHNGSAAQNISTRRSSKNSNAKVLYDRINVAHRSSQMWTKNNSPGIKRTRNLCKENERPKTVGLSKTTKVCLIPTASVLDLAKNSQKFVPRSAKGDIGNCMSDNCSGGNVSCSIVTAHSSTMVNVMRTESLSAVTQVTASCRISSAVSSSVPVLKSSPVSFHSCVTSTLFGHISVPSAVSYASPVSGLTVSSGTAVLSESVKLQVAGGGRSSFGSSSAVLRLQPSAIRTPQNQLSVRGSCSSEFVTPGQLVTPCNQSIRSSSMMKPTPPMCSCGCRAKRKFVQSPGQNLGRAFYCCGANTRTSRKGCNFFKWENSCSVAHSSYVTPLSTKQFLSMHTVGRSANFTPRQATSFRILVPPSLK